MKPLLIVASIVGSVAVSALVVWHQDRQIKDLKEQIARIPAEVVKAEAQADAAEEDENAANADTALPDPLPTPIPPTISLRPLPLPTPTPDGMML